jgi:eukaryotic-like serine/threonine-protein kinase
MEDDRLQDLAASVADGRAVDWQQAEQEASDEEMKRVVRALREISDVAQAHQSWHESLTVQASREGDPTLERWGSLVILEKVGEGSFGEVFRARDPQLDREVALKLLRHADDSGADQETAVIEEGRLLARVRHPNVATVYGADRRDGRVGLWMEFLQGRTLAELVREQGPLGAKEAVFVGLDLCRALAAVHAKGILHRDIKAQNVMRETGGRFVLMDFGVGRDLRSEASSDRNLSGTPLYLAPEALAGGESSVRSDIYSLGVLLFYLVTGTFPVRGSSLDELRKAHEQGEIRLLRDLRPDLPEGFVQVIDRALLRDPGRRYASAGTLEQALQEALRRESSGPSFNVGRRLFRLVAVVGAIALLAGLWFWWRSSKNPAPVTGARTVLIADFDNRTGQQVFDPTVRHLVSIALSQSLNFRVVPHEHITEALKRMRRPLNAPLDSDTAQELCVREGIPIWISGEIVRSGPAYSLTMSAVGTESRKVLAFETVALQDPSEMIHKVGVAIEDLRRRLGEPEALIQQNHRPLEQVTTSSLEALYRYSQALDLHAAENIELAVKALEAAVRLDPQFAMAHSRLALYTGGIGDNQESFRAAEQAYNLRDRVSERESYQISATYHLDCLQYEEALKDYQQAVILDPSDSDSYRQIAMLHANMGEPHAGIEAARKGRDLPPASVINAGVLALLLAEAGRPDEALQEVRTARKRFGNEIYLYWPEGIAWQIKGDGERARLAFKALKEGDTTYDSHARILLAQSLMLDGKNKEAQELLESGSSIDKRLHFDRNEAMGNLLLAKIHALRGEIDKAKDYLEYVEELPDLPMNLKLLRAAGVLAAEIGDLERANRFQHRVEKLHDLYPSALSRAAAAQIRGSIATTRGDFERARQSLEEARLSWEDASLLVTEARLSLAEQQCDEAKALFRQILENKARSFGDFFSLWADWSEALQDSPECPGGRVNSIDRR